MDHTCENCETDEAGPREKEEMKVNDQEGHGEPQMNCRMEIELGD